jgi:polyphosphate kinase
MGAREIEEVSKSVKRLSVIEDVDDLQNPRLYLNRELSQIHFVRRVLAQAKDPTVPLLERMRFLTICSALVDEFFEVRVAGVRQRINLELPASGPDGMPPAELLRSIRSSVRDLNEDLYAVLNDVLLPELADQEIRLLRRDDLSQAQRAWIRDYFDREALPVLTPIALDQAHPFPNLVNKSLAFIVTLTGSDAFRRTSNVAVVQVPRCLPRVLQVPEEVADGPYDFIAISAVIHANMERLFPGMRVTGCHQFRLTRNSDLWLDHEEVDDLLSALQGELPQRNFGDAVRLEVATSCHDHIATELLQRVGLASEDLYQVNGPVNLSRLGAIVDLVDRPELKYPRFSHGMPDVLREVSSIFDVLDTTDVLLHHPYQSFAPTMDMVRHAARDPDVLAIKQTLYRTEDESEIVDALIDAARAGKAVTVLIELRARFDEANNIKLATRLQQAGANVVYGVVGYKVHGKALMIVRRVGDGIRRYVHLGTGNYHAGTARFYTDFGLMSSDPELGEDLHRLFLQVAGLGAAPRMKTLIQAPFHLADRLNDFIEDEIKAAEKGREAWIRARMNSLTDPGIIRALYRASQAGVRVELLVRGVCRLRPGIPGISENVVVRSLVGRFLEHSRVFQFCANGEGRAFFSSADWMERNLHRRVELCVPLTNPPIRERILHEGLNVYFQPGTATWELQPDGRWSRTDPGDDGYIDVQEQLLKELSG